MSVEHHNLVTEFPEFKELIHELKVDNRHFQKLAGEQHELDKEIRRHDENIEPVSDAYLEGLKKKRLGIMDAIYAMLREHTKA